MATITLKTHKATEFLEQWLHRAGDSSDTVDVEVLPGQLVIKQKLVDEVELKAWLQGAMARYDTALRRLADA